MGRQVMIGIREVEAAHSPQGTQPAVVVVEREYQAVLTSQAFPEEEAGA